jgi:xanthine/uracil permease
MPAVVSGPIVAIIGLSLAGNAIGDLFKGSYYITTKTTGIVESLKGKTFAENLKSQSYVVWYFMFYRNLC